MKSFLSILALSACRLAAPVSENNDSPSTDYNYPAQPIHDLHYNIPHTNYRRGGNNVVVHGPSGIIKASIPENYHTNYQRDGRKAVVVHGPSGFIKENFHTKYRRNEVIDCPKDEKLPKVVSGPSGIIKTYHGNSMVKGASGIILSSAKGPTFIAGPSGSIAKN